MEVEGSFKITLQGMEWRKRGMLQPPCALPERPQQQAQYGNGTGLEDAGKDLWAA